MHRAGPLFFSAVLSPSSFYLHGAQINLARPKGSDREDLGYNGSVSSSPELLIGQVDDQEGR